MSYALSSGVTGLQAHQKMLDVAGNNLANVNTTAFKSSQVTFSELLGETLQQASQPTAQIGGTNPQQMGSGVGVSGITPNMSQGNIVKTGNPLDVALEGAGYFVVSDGERSLYSRAGTFGVDESGYLVDPSTGYRVQRLGLVGEADGFQIPGSSGIRVPYDVALSAQQTSEIIVSGNLSSDASGTPMAQVLTGSSKLTHGSSDATETTLIGELDQFSGSATPSGTISFEGYQSDGTALTGSLAIGAGTTVGDVIDYLNNTALDGATASLVNGQIRITDNQTGYSRLDMTMSYAGAGTLDLPGYFELTSVGGDEVKGVNIAVYDSQGGKHVLSAAFVRSDTINTWDLVLTSVTGNIASVGLDSRRIEGITFDARTGAFNGLPDGETAAFNLTFDHDVDHAQTIRLNLGTVGSFDGLTQFAGNSTAVAREQDGYEAGNLSAVSVNNEGVLIGSFSNGIKKDLAVLAIALFKNAAGLQGAGNGYYVPSANSGAAVVTQAMSGGAGSIHGGSLEKSNADVATEFVSLILAQNGFQANARTISVANDILRELTNLIR
ncbi:flagellar hook protein FlgE [Anaerobaca lacustris]|uniref:Flagellar hook protein FlgE n=1 Tax=Anaerobaca lacustris TaxID=3044600 RepID=A0AAW6TU30_9BACT|nr:flagellar hook-basal body complex protein [Sedimentisphaerales bacterium M17dextr]